MEQGDVSPDVHAPCRARIVEFEALVAKLHRQIEQLTAEQQKQIEQLTGQVEQLTARLNQNSQNSSKPPSSDPPSAPPRTKKEPTGRRPGGQPGHPGHGRELLPIAKVHKVVVLKPERCGGCGHPLHGDDPAPLRHQVTEVPPIHPEVTEYQRHRLSCPDCQKTTTADLPAGVPEGTYGPRVQAMTAYLSGQDHLSKRLTEQTMKDLLGVSISEASVVAQEQAVSQAVAGAVDEARVHVQQQPVVHADETGWPQAGKLGWLWVAVTQYVTVFLIHAKRGAVAAQALLGSFAGYLVTDRWGGYNGWKTRRRQLCWAHLIRDFKGFLERGQEAARIGGKLLAEVHRMIAWWKRVRDGTLARATFRNYMGPVRRAVESLLEEGTRCGESKTEGMCRKILKFAPALWTFVRVPGIEPTNNAAERAIRPAVLYRKGSFGTHSQDGSRFVERILTVVATLRQQGRNVLEYLTEACVAAQLGRPAPSLLPTPATRVAA